MISAAAVSAVGVAGSAPTLLGSAATASPVQSIGINGNTVYACDTNEISVINVSSATTPVVSGTVSSPASTTNTYCDVQRGSLVQMIDGNPPTFVTYDITNPASPKQIFSVPVNKNSSARRFSRATKRSSE